MNAKIIDISCRNASSGDIEVTRIDIQLKPENKWEYLALLYVRDANVKVAIEMNEVLNAVKPSQSLCGLGL